MGPSTVNERYVKRQVSVIRVYMCSERHLTFRRNIDTRRQWSVGNIGRNEWLYWEIVINDHCHGSVASVLVCSRYACHGMHKSINWNTSRNLISKQLLSFTLFFGQQLLYTIYPHFNVRNKLKTGKADVPYLPVPGV